MKYIYYDYKEKKVLTNDRIFGDANIRKYLVLLPEDLSNINVNEYYGYISPRSLLIIGEKCFKLANGYYVFEDLCLCDKDMAKRTAGWKGKVAVVCDEFSKNPNLGVIDVKTGEFLIPFSSSYSSIEPITPDLFEAFSEGYSFILGKNGVLLERIAGSYSRENGKIYRCDNNLCTRPISEVSLDEMRNKFDKISKLTADKNL